MSRSHDSRKRPGKLNGQPGQDARRHPGGPEVPGPEPGSEAAGTAREAELRGLAKEVAWLARFPSENPNPVLRVSADGAMLYSNRASAPLLDTWQCGDGRPLPDPWRHVARDALSSGGNRQAEVECRDRVFSLTFAPVVDYGYVNVYALDVTERKQAAESLREAKKELERRVQQRTVELSRTVEDLQSEVADRIGAEEALRRSEGRLAEAQRIAHVGNWDWDIVHNDLWWSDEIYRIFGLAPHEFQATYDAFLATVHPDDVESVKRSVDEALHERKPYSIDHRIVLPDGTERIVHERAVATFDADGNAVRMQGTVQDITERKRAQRAGEAERRRLFAVLNMLPGFVSLITRDYTIEFANHVYRDSFGEPGDRTCHTIQSDRDEPCKDCPVEDVFETGRQTDWEWNSAAGRTYHVWGYPFSDSDGTAMVLQLGIDITERKKLEKEVLEISETERRRIGRDLHDTLGQTLTGLVFLIQGLARKSADHFPEDAATADQTVELVKEAIGQVRSMAKGLDPVSLSSGGLDAGLGDLADNVERLFGLSCRFVCEDDIAIEEAAVATQMYYIAQEAVNNAVKHARATHIRIRMERNDEGISLAVEDDGVGVRDGRDEGKGMGMRTMRYRAGVVGGSLSIAPGPRGGTVVTCSLPHRPGQHSSEGAS